MHVLAESDNNVNLDESEVMVLESAEAAMVCASIDGVTEIERGFTGNFEFISDDEFAGNAQNCTFTAAKT